MTQGYYPMRKYIQRPATQRVATGAILEIRENVPESALGCHIHQSWIEIGTETEEHRKFFGVTCKGSMMQSTWEEEVAPLNLQVGERVSLTFNDSNTLVSIERK